MTTEQRFELMLASTRKRVEWIGTSGEDAARRYVDCHRGDVVIASRPIVHGVFIGVDTRGGW